MYSTDVYGIRGGSMVRTRTYLTEQQRDQLGRHRQNRGAVTMMKTMLTTAPLLGLVLLAGCGKSDAGPRFPGRRSARGHV